MNVKCTIITIGDELLIGQTIDTNSAFIAQKLAELGIKIHRRIAVSDQTDEIKLSIAEAFQTSHIVITTGGLGPTKDDITKKTICEIYGVGMTRDEETLKHIKGIFERRNVEILDVNLAQADIPSNAKVLFNNLGTAPGMWIEENENILISLPGVPYEMENLIVAKAIPKLKSKFELPSLYYQYIQTSGLGESFLAKQIYDIENSLPSSISLAYLPSPMNVNLRLSGLETDKNTIDQKANEIRSKLSEYVYGNSKTTIVEQVFEKLKSSGKTISFAESCTGGYLSHIFTNIKGSSSVLTGAWTVYSDEFKNSQLNISKELLEKYSSVSKECCEELFKQAIIKSKSDYAISVVGHLEKSESYPQPFAIITYGDITNFRTIEIKLNYPRLKSKEAIANVAYVHFNKHCLIDKIF